MFRRRKRKNQTANATQAESPLPDRAPNIDESPPTTIATHVEKKRSPVLSDVFKSTIEKAADRLRSELVSEGKLKPMVFFVDADGAMKTVSLSVKDDEYQKEALIRRIREKVSAENISTVITLTEVDNEHGAVLSGVSPDMKGSARVDYSFDNKTKSVTSWRVSWPNQPVQNVFLDSIFERKG
jgi:hypothetical protein